jgi:hypothetical protein
VDRGRRRRAGLRRPGAGAADIAGGDFDTFANLALVLNYTGNALGWAVALPLYGVAILTTGAVPRWLGWLALAAAAIAGWLGIAVLRRQRSAAV